MNTNRRVVQVQEQTFRIGRQPQQRSFLDSCDPNGIPRYLRDVDRYMAIQNQAWDLVSTRLKSILFFGFIFGPPILTVVITFLYLRAHGH